MPFRMIIPVLALLVTLFSHLQANLSGASGEGTVKGAVQGDIKPPAPVQPHIQPKVQPHKHAGLSV